MPSPAVRNLPAPRPRTIGAGWLLLIAVVSAGAWGGVAWWSQAGRDRIIVVVGDARDSLEGHAVARGARQAGRDFEVAITIVPGESVPQRVISQLSRIIETRPTGICLPAVIDEDTCRPLITLAQRRGIAVTAMRRDLPALRRELTHAGFGFVGSAETTAPVAASAAAHAFAEGYLAVTQIILHHRYGMPGLFIRTGTAAAAPTTSTMPRGPVEVVFFAGGDAGHSFSDRLIQGALAAEADLGCRVRVVRSGWDRARMVQQLDEILPQQPNAVCFPGHPGSAVLAPRVEQAHAAGIIFTTFNVDLPELRQTGVGSGFGFVGADQEEAGRLMAESCVRAFGLVPGDRVVVLPVQTPAVSLREVRSSTVVTSLRAAGVEVEVVPMPRPVELAGDLAAAGGADFLAALVAVAPTSKLLVVDAPTIAPLLRPALRQRELTDLPAVACFDLDAGIVAGMADGDVALALDQLPFVQGYGAVLQAYLSTTHRLPGITIETGRNVVTPATVHRLRDSIQRQVR